MMARTALRAVQRSPTESIRDFAMPFPVPASKNICQISNPKGIIDNVLHIKTSNHQALLHFEQQ
jgi:hypothetical protein